MERWISVTVTDYTQARAGGDGLQPSAKSVNLIAAAGVRGYPAGPKPFNDR
jgi:hypothetical protein